MAAISSTISTTKSSQPEIVRVDDLHEPVRSRVDRTENDHRDGWRFTQFDGSCQLDEVDSSVLNIADTRMEGRAGAVRAHASFGKGRASWRIEALEVSDWSYIGMVTSHWTGTSHCIGRAPFSYGLSSNGTVWANRREIKKSDELQFGSGAIIVFELDCLNQYFFTRYTIVDCVKN